MIELQNNIHISKLNQHKIAIKYLELSTTKWRYTRASNRHLGWFVQGFNFDNGDAGIIIFRESNDMKEFHSRY